MEAQLVTVEPPDRQHRERSTELATDFLTGFDFPTSRHLHERSAPSDTEVKGDGENHASKVSEPEPGRPEASAYPLYDNIYVLVPAHVRLDSEEAAELGLDTIPNDVDQFDLRGQDRIYELASKFVRNHVRRVKARSAIKAGGRLLSDRAIVISEKRFSRLPFRFARLSWAVDRNAVVDVHDQKVLCGRLTKVVIPPQRVVWGAGSGDTFDVAYLLANVCAILGMHVPVPVAATGAMELRTNQIVGNDPIEDKRLAAQKSGIAHLILPVGARFMPGLHGGVRYWPVYNVDHAIYSLFSASCDRAT